MFSWKKLLKIEIYATQSKEAIDVCITPDYRAIIWLEKRNITKTALESYELDKSAAPSDLIQSDPTFEKLLPPELRSCSVLTKRHYKKVESVRQMMNYSTSPL